MEIIEKRLYFCDLIRLYGELLSSTQKEILIDHFQFDLSISEIAENRGISRAAVEDAIKKGAKKLNEYEDKLRFYNKEKKILEKTEILKEKFGNCSEIEEIEEEIK